MGAGAGYSIETKDVKIVGDIQITSFNVEADKWWLSTKVHCIIPILASVRADSYMYGCPWIENVSMTVTGIEINFMKTEEYPDVTEDMIREVLENPVNYWGKGVYGGGWTHSKFDGEYEIKQFSKVDYMDDIDSVEIKIDDELVVDFIDLAVQGENLEYEVIFNDDAIESYESEDEAIQALKATINDTIAEYGPEGVNFNNCYVEQMYWILLNGEGEDDLDVDSVYRVYNASDDPDYEDIY